MRVQSAPIDLLRTMSCLGSTSTPWRAMLANTLWLEGHADRATLEVPYGFADAATEIRNDDISGASAISRSSSWHGFRALQQPK